MGFKDLTPEQQENLKTAKTPEELDAIAAEDGFELSDEMLEGIAGGYGNRCPRDWGCSKDTISAGPAIV